MQHLQLLNREMNIRPETEGHDSLHMLQQLQCSYNDTCADGDALPGGLNAAVG